MPNLSRLKQYSRSVADLWIDGMILDCENCKLGQVTDDYVCCARRALGDCPDFQVDQCWLQETINKAGHMMIFLPKFQCELNYTEMIWGYAKTRLRRTCGYSFGDLQKQLPQLLSDGIPLSFFKKAQRHCFRYMDAYRVGLTGELLEYAATKYRGHRMIPRNQVELIPNNYTSHSLVENVL